MEENQNTVLNYCFNCMKPLETGATVCPHCGYDNSVKRNEDNTLPEGTILYGKYLVGKVLGKGGFGVSYLGIDLSLDVSVAIKEFFPVGVSNRTSHSITVVAASSSLQSGFEKGCDEFQTEAKTLARFNSSNIVHVRGYFRENGTAYIVMDYVEGNSLTQEALENNGRLPWQRVVDLFKPLILELDKLHQKNLIHRDIKPDNIKVVKEENGSEHLVLLDFGAARSFFSSQITKTYTATVTHGYAPIEQYSQKGHQGPYTDVYALCSTMYSVITGEIPPSATDRAACAGEIASFKSFGLDVPEVIERAIFHGMELQAVDRPQSMQELYDELEGKKVPPVHETPVIPDEKEPGAASSEEKQPDAGKDRYKSEKKKGKGWVIPLVLVVLLGIGFFVFRSMQQNQKNAAATQTAVSLNAAMETQERETLDAAETADAAAILDNTSTASAGQTEQALQQEAEQQTATREAALQGTAVRQTAVQQTATREAVLQMTADQQTAEQLAADQQAALQRIAEQQTATQEAVWANQTAAAELSAQEYAQRLTETEAASMLTRTIEVLETRTAVVVQTDAAATREAVSYFETSAVETDTAKFEGTQTAMAQTASALSQLEVAMAQTRDAIFAAQTLTAAPTDTPVPTLPTDTPAPTLPDPTKTPTAAPTVAPTATPTVTPTATRTPAPTMTPTQKIVTPEPTKIAKPLTLVIYTGVVNQANDTGVILRDAPSMGAGIIRSLPNGTKIFLTGNGYNEGNNDWIMVQTAEGLTGWVLNSSVNTSKIAIPPTQLKSGNMIIYGQYEQDNDPTNGPEPIEWQVLAVEGERALLLSRYGLDSKKYNSSSKNVTWETCTLREWLNGEFYDTAFTDGEKIGVIEVNHENPNNNATAKAGGNPTDDKIFLLSVNDVNQYIRSFETRKCVSTAYSKAYVFSNGRVFWWLRTPGLEYDRAVRVNADGSVDINGYSVTDSTTVVRPAFWLDLSEETGVFTVATEAPVSGPQAASDDIRAAADSMGPVTLKRVTNSGTIDLKFDTGVLLRDAPSNTAGILRSLPNMTTVVYLGKSFLDNGIPWIRVRSMEGLEGWIPQSAVTMSYSDILSSDLRVGDIFIMGKYEQNGVTSDGTEPVEWQVLSVEDGLALVTSRFALDTRAYHSSRSNVTWEGSLMRQWLNGDFYNRVFSKEEQKRIFRVLNTTQDNSEYGTSGGRQTTDRIFLLSIDEAEKYFNNDVERACEATLFAKMNGANAAGSLGSSPLWLRSSGSSNELVSIIMMTGEINTNGYYVDNNNTVVRPAFWLIL